MTRARDILVITGLIAAILACNKAMTEDATNYNLPIVDAAAPLHGFVCTPTLTPHLGPVHPKELA